MKEIAKFFGKKRRKYTTHGMVYVIVFALFVGNCCPMVKVHAQSTVEVTNYTEFSRAIDNATSTTAEAPLIINVKGTIPLTNAKFISAKHIKIISDGTGKFTSTNGSTMWTLDQGSTLTLENIAYDYTGSSSYNKSSIKLNGNATLIMNQGSTLSGTSRDIITVGGVGNTIIMNEGSLIHSKNDATGIKGGSLSLTMNTGSTIQGNQTSPSIDCSGNGNVITINGGQIIDGNKGIGMDGSNNILNLNAGLITSVGTGVYMGSGTGNTILMKDGMAIANNTYTGLYMVDGTTFTMLGGTIKNNSTSDAGGGIMAYGPSNISIQGGIIENNKSGIYGAGISTDDKVDIEMSGGIIRNNICQNGTFGTGGIYVSRNSTFQFSGGSIETNIGKVGGGIYQFNGGAVSLSGGIITKNKAEQGAGVYASDSNVTISKDVVVKDNTLTDGITANNVELSEVSYNLQIGGELTGNVGVTLSDNSVGNEFAEGSNYQITENDANNFHSDLGFGTTIKDNKLFLGPAAKDIIFETDLDTTLRVVKQNEKVKLQVKSVSEDQDNLHYQWFVHNQASTEGATQIVGNNKNQLVVDNALVGTLYYYVIVTNNKNHTTKTITSKLTPISVYEEIHNTGSIKGNVSNEDAQATVEDTSIKLYRGNTLLQETMSDANGDFVFRNLPYGIYNLVAEKGSQKITMKIVVDKSLMTSSIILPIGVRNTIVETLGAQTPPVVVAGLNELYTQKVKDDTKGITEKDLQVLQGGGAIEIKFVAERKQESTIQQEANKLNVEALKDDKAIGMYIDISLIKSIKDVSQNVRTSKLSEVPSTLEITIEIPEDLKKQKNLQVYRIHEGQIQKLPMKQGDEYFTIDGDYLVIHAKKYSIYALGYDKAVEPEIPEKPEEPTKPATPEQPTSPEKPSTSVDPVRPKIEGVNTQSPTKVLTGDATNIARSSFTMMSSMGIMAIAYHKMKQQYINHHDEDCFYGIRNKLRFANFLFHQAVKDVTKYLLNKMTK